MRLHTDKLSPMNVTNTFQALKQAKFISRGVKLEPITKYGSRSRKMGMEVKLIARHSAGPFLAGEVREYLVDLGATDTTLRVAARRHNKHANTDKDATWHECGVLMEAIYELDPEALWDGEGWAEFDNRTFGRPMDVNLASGRFTNFGYVLADAHYRGKLDLDTLE